MCACARMYSAHTVRIKMCAFFIFVRILRTKTSPSYNQFKQSLECFDTFFTVLSTVTTKIAQERFVGLEHICTWMGIKLLRQIFVDSIYQRACIHVHQNDFVLCIANQAYYNSTSRAAS
ncbi:Hypothetical_protein [Hexamita inflata]|uniref:Hypothetical_protein n=1 Tax=Hexamita inflata TaxID=28002 RepID=A0AA86PJV3_9EUKA|nr:Hypothetical protein HINF_LOCUS26153 [Hexamita inflata]